MAQPDISIVQNEPSETLDSVFSPDGSGPSDVIAREEASSLAAGIDLEKDGKAQEHNRHQTFRNHINFATIILFWCLVTGLILGVVVFTWHLLTPQSCAFLSSPQLEKLQTILVAAITSSALTGYVKNRMN